MANFTLFHNPRCSKSRQALEYLNQTGIEVDIREYLKVPLSLEEIQTLFKALQFDNAMDMIRTKEKEFKEAGLSKNASNQDILAAIADHPKLLERPIISDNKNAAIGRPLENIVQYVANAE
jgi:arsenate reductase